MKDFTRLYGEIDATTSTNEKVEALKRFFANAKPVDAMWAVLILTGRLEKRVITSRVLREAFLLATKYPEWLFEESYHHVGDTAETLSLLLRSLDLAQPGHAGTSSRPLHQWMETEIPRVARLRDPQERAAALLELWREMSVDEIFVFNKLMTGGFRVGVSEKLVVRALCESFDVASDQIAHRLTGKIRPGEDQFEALITKDETQILGSKPYPFCLAHAWNERSAAAWEPEAWAVEWKFDGIRSQVIKRDGGLWIWSRGEEEVSKQFPELVKAFFDLPDGSVIDGEVLVIRDGRIQDFNTLQKRLNRKTQSAALLKEAPVGFIAYDCLESHREDVRQLPLRERREELRRLLAPFLSDRVRISEVLPANSLAQIEALRSRSRAADAEGLMIKAWESPYSVGRKTGHWWKHKVDPLTLDAVLIYAQAGTGRRANLYTDYTFALWRDGELGPELVPFAKAYSGLDQSEIDELDRWIRGHTREKFGPVRSLEPVQVFEIGFEGIAASPRHKSGIAVRFPRILRWRRDKAAADADSLATAFELLDTKEGRRTAASGPKSLAIKEQSPATGEPSLGIGEQSLGIEEQSPDVGERRALRGDVSGSSAGPNSIASPVGPRA